MISAGQRAGLVQSEESAADLALSAWSCARAGVESGAASGKVVWVARAISVLVSLIFVISAVMKLMGGAEVKEGIKRIWGCRSRC